MKTMIGWLKFNENKDKDCTKCHKMPCVCKKGDELEKEEKDEEDEADSGKSESISLAAFRAEYDSLSIEEKRQIPEGFKKFLKKKKTGKKIEEKDDKKK